MNKRTLKPTDSRRTLKDHILAVYGMPMSEYDNILAVDDRDIIYDIYPSRDGWTKLQLNVLFPTLYEYLDADCQTNKDAWLKFDFDRALFVRKDVADKFTENIDCLNDKTVWQNAFSLMMLDEKFRKDKKVDNFAFIKIKNVETYHVPDGVTLIGSSAFLNKELKHIYLPESVNSIYECALTVCSGLRTLHLGHHDPKKIESELEIAICSDEESYMCDPQPEDIVVNEFPDNSVVLYVPDDALETYKADTSGVFGMFRDILAESDFIKRTNSQPQKSCKYNIDYLKREIEYGRHTEFLFFWGHKEHREHVTRACLSQWYPCEFTVDGVKYNCAEQYMMAEKARVFDDAQTLRLIMATDDQKTIKELGRRVRNFDSAKWDSVKQSAVIKGNIAKFSQNEKLKRFLLWTGDKVLVEASPYDKIWGIGMKSTDENVEHISMWKGLNLLGFALMEVRDVIKQKNR